LYLLGELVPPDSEARKHYWYGLADAAHGVLPGVYGRRAPVTEDVFTARIIAAYDLVHEACEACDGRNDDHQVTALLGIACDALDWLLTCGGEDAPEVPREIPRGRGSARFAADAIGRYRANVSPAN
jgi:hypothetical protein